VLVACDGAPFADALFNAARVAAESLDARIDVLGVTREVSGDVLDRQSILRLKIDKENAHFTIAQLCLVHHHVHHYGAVFAAAETNVNARKIIEHFGNSLASGHNNINA
jgi:hypothetical protein